jgi:hypothetical protein
MMQHRCDAFVGPSCMLDVLQWLAHVARDVVPLRAHISPVFPYSRWGCDLFAIFAGEHTCNRQVTGLPSGFGPWRQTIFGFLTKKPVYLASLWGSMMGLLYIGCWEHV